MAAEIEIVGLEEAQRVYAIDLKRVWKRGLRVAVAHVRNRLAWYPAPPPNSTYVRTGSLGRSWAGEVRTLAGAVTGVVGNTMPYAPAVQDLDMQRDVHRGRWRTVQGVAEDEADVVSGFIQQALNDELTRSGAD